MTSTPRERGKDFRRRTAAGGRQGARRNQGRRATNRWRGTWHPSSVGQLHDTDRAGLEIGLLGDRVPFGQRQLVGGMSHSIGTAATWVVEIAVVERGKDHTLPDAGNACRDVDRPSPRLDAREIALVNVECR